MYDSFFASPPALERSVCLPTTGCSVWAQARLRLCVKNAVCQMTKIGKERPAHGGQTRLPRGSSANMRSFAGAVPCWFDFRSRNSSSGSSFISASLHCLEMINKWNASSALCVCSKFAFLWLNWHQSMSIGWVGAKMTIGRIQLISLLFRTGQMASFAWRRRLIKIKIYSGRRSIKAWKSRTMFD